MESEQDREAPEAGGEAVSQAVMANVVVCLAPAAPSGPVSKSANQEEQGRMFSQASIGEKGYPFGISPEGVAAHLELLAKALRSGSAVPETWEVSGKFASDNFSGGALALTFHGIAKAEGS